MRIFAQNYFLYRWFRAENKGSALLYFAHKYGDESFRSVLQISYDTIDVVLTVTPPECYNNSVEDVVSSFVKDNLLTGNLLNIKETPGDQGRKCHAARPRNVRDGRSV